MVLAIDSTALLSPLPPKLTAPLLPPPLWPPPLPLSFAATRVKSEGGSDTLAVIHRHWCMRLRTLVPALPLSPPASEA